MPKVTSHLPSMTVLIPAHNEEEVIEARIVNLLEQDYPDDLLEIVVVSDVSTDETVAIASRFKDRNVRVIELTERLGKLGIIDAIAPSLSGDIVTITDANVKCGKDALKNLGLQFNDPQIGAVGGNLRLKSPEQASNVGLEETYRRYEIRLKKQMSNFGKVIGIYGGLYAFRRELFTPIQREGSPCHDDVIIPLEIVQKGYQVKFAEDAYAVEETTPSIFEEFRRRVRMTAYNLNSLPRTISLSLKTGAMLFYIAFSYKVIRWLSPFLITILFLLSILLANVHSIYSCAVVTFLIGIALSLIGAVLDRFRLKVWLATAAYHFAIMNLAGFVGLVNWVKGAKGHWTPRGM